MRRRMMMAGGGAPPVPGIGWDAARKDSDITLSGTDSTIATSNATTGWGSVFATLGRSTGKHYFEILCNDVKTTWLFGGIGNGSAGTGTYLGDSAGAGNHGGLWCNQGGGDIAAWYDKLTDTPTNGNPSPNTKVTNGQTIGIAVDMDALQVSWYVQNVHRVTRTLKAGQTWYPALSLKASAFATGRFKSADFAYSPPAGFSPWQT